jgi:hypothetical protein
MAEVILKTNEPDKVSEILKDALEIEKSRVEQKYNISSEKFISQWASEDLENSDLEYVEWAGEYQFALTLNERLTALKSIEYVSP